MKKTIKLIKGPVSLILMLSFLVAIIVPLPPLLIDLAVVFSLALAITVYMKGNTIEEWEELKTFPTILLLTAIFRIALNISTTRRILHDGEPGTVIEAAGSYIVGSNIWIGIVMLIILIVVQFIVANGASRTAEVNARFTLDGLPMKQMSIDSDINNGAITAEEAKERRKKLDMEVDFYGNMDGAGKFIKGDVIAGIVLVVVNIVFGLIIGVAVQGMTLGDAAYRFTLLTIGDGLVNQLASLLLAIASGVVMTRIYSGERENVTQSIFRELTSSSLVIYVVSGLLAFLGIFTKMPFFPFIVMSLVLFAIGFMRQQAEKVEKVTKQQAKSKEDVEEFNPMENPTKMETGVEPIAIEIGAMLIPLAGEERKGETLQQKIIIMRQSILNDLGIVLPKIHTMDNLTLPLTSYQIRIKGTVVATGELKIDRLLAVPGPYHMDDVEGEETVDPIVGGSALWIKEEMSDKAIENGYMVFDSIQILTHHLNEVVRQHISTLLQRQEVHDLIESISETHGVLKKELDKYNVKLSVVQGVLKNLLSEGISIRDLPLILEAVIDAYELLEQTNKQEPYHTVDEITLVVRQRMAKFICDKAKDDKTNKLHAIIVHPNLEKQLTLVMAHNGYFFELNMKKQQQLMHVITEEVRRA